MKPEKAKRAKQVGESRGESRSVVEECVDKFGEDPFVEEDASRHSKSHFLATVLTKEAFDFFLSARKENF